MSAVNAALAFDTAGQEHPINEIVKWQKVSFPNSIVIDVGEMMVYTHRALSCSVLLNESFEHSSERFAGYAVVEVPRFFSAVP